MSQFAKKVVEILLLLAWMKMAEGKERNEMLTILPGQRFSNDVRGKYEAGQFHSKVECTARLLQIETSSSAMFCRNNMTCFTSSHPSKLTTKSTEDDADCEIINSNEVSKRMRKVLEKYKICKRQLVNLKQILTRIKFWKETNTPRVSKCRDEWCRTRDVLMVGNSFGFTTRDSTVLRLNDAFGTFSCPLDEGGWKYVFGAKKGTGIRLYDAWDNDLYTCTDEHCNDIYKSEIVNNWDTSNITKVLVVLFDKMTDGAWLEFDGKGSGKDDWFSESRLYDSSWSDLATSDHNRFDQNAFWFTPHRFFYISHQWGGCQSDLLWIVVSEPIAALVRCNFDKHSSYPQFVYSSSDYMKGENELALADRFTVYIKQGH